VIGDNPIAEVLAAPLGPGWTVEALAEQVLRTVAARNHDDTQEFILDAESVTDRQTRRLLRSFIACLAMKFAAEAGTACNLFGGQLAFKRSGPDGLVCITGEFDNRPRYTRIVLRSSGPRPEERPVCMSEGAEPART
jgi:hypothetical protein